MMRWIWAYRSSMIVLPSTISLRSIVRSASSNRTSITSIDGCAGAGFSPQVAFEGGELHIVRALVRERLGLAGVPRSVAIDPGLHAATMVPHVPARIVSLAWRRERSRAAPVALLAFAREYLRDPAATSD